MQLFRITLLVLTLALAAMTMLEILEWASTPVSFIIPFTAFWLLLAVVYLICKLIIKIPEK